MPEPTRHRPLRRFAARALHTLVTLVVATTLAVPVVAWAGHQFGDVPGSNTFHADIDWLADNEVTKGCNPPANTEYCPGDFVTREQMAAFLHRLETEGVLLPADGKAVDADRLDGKNSTFYRLRCTDGRLLFLGMCFERGPRTGNTHGGATGDCVAEAMRLPSHGELHALRELVGTDGVTMDGSEWTSDLADMSTVYRYAWVGTFGSGAAPHSDTLAYRCVAGPAG